MRANSSASLLSQNTMLPTTAAQPFSLRFRLDGACAPVTVYVHVELGSIKWSTKVIGRCARR
eukprot:3334842-Pyramimonas_sp.AAC.1